MKYESYFYEKKIDENFTFYDFLCMYLKSQDTHQKFIADFFSFFAFCNEQKFTPIANTCEIIKPIKKSKKKKGGKYELNRRRSKADS